METGQTRGLVFDIQGHSVHDGPGSRTLVCLSGCPLRCKWCCNPEGMQLRQRLMYRVEKCGHCPTRCVDVCPRHAIRANENGNGTPIGVDRAMCDDCETFECVANCYMQALQVSGKWMSVEELMRLLERDRAYWSTDGGVTFGGGEPLFQKDFLLSILKRCHDSSMHTALETSAYATSYYWLEALKYIQFAFIDLKHMDDVRHQEATGVSNLPILRNLRCISNSKWTGRVILRSPIVPGFNDTVENAEATASFMVDSDLREINLLPFHRLGSSKYEQLGLACDFAEQAAVAPSALTFLRAVYESKGIACYIGSETPF